MTDNNRVIIFDTTLRDGEQSPGASMTREEKMRIAKQLEKMRVDVIEAGFAIASPGDFESVKSIADTIKDSTICSLSRALDADIDRAGEALKNANSGRIHTFIATSPIHMQYKLQMEPPKVIEQAVYAVKRARNLIDDVEFSLEDASRSELDFMCRIIEQVIDAGARTINIPDTVGYAVPEEFGHTIKQLIERIPNSDKAIFSVHCHNDLGLAVANSLAAVNCGARQVECTINGLGERAGNASLEEIVMALRTREDVMGLHTGIDTTQIVPASRHARLLRSLIKRFTGKHRPGQHVVIGNSTAFQTDRAQNFIQQNLLMGISLRCRLTRVWR
jgi:2-isopropylmalate synthase